MDVLSIIFISIMAIIPIGFIVAIFIQDARHKKEMVSIFLEDILHYANKINELKVDSIDKFSIEETGKDPRLEIYCTQLIANCEKIKKLLKIDKKG